MEPVRCPFCNPDVDEIVAKNDLCFWPLGSVPGEQGAPACDSVPAYSGFFLDDSGRESGFDLFD